LGGYVVVVWVAGAGCDEFFDNGDGLDSAASAYGGAVECCGSAGEVELAIELPVLEEAVDEAGVKDVAGAGGVDDRDEEGAGVVEAATVEGEDSSLSQGCRGEDGAVAAMHKAEGGFQVGLVSEASGKIAADDEVIDEGKEIVDIGVEFVEVGNDGDSRFAGPAGGEDGSLGVVAVDVEGAGAGDPLALEVGRPDSEGLVAAPEDGALAVVVDEDEGLLAQAVGGTENAGVDAGAGEGVAMELGGVVGAELANVAGGERPVGAGDDGGGDLSAGEDAGVAIFEFGAALGVVGEGEDSIGGVKTDADEVNLGDVDHGSSGRSFSS